MPNLICRKCGEVLSHDEAVYNYEVWSGPLCEDCAEEMSNIAYGEVYAGSFMDDDS